MGGVLMPEFVLGERRRTPRWAGDQLPEGYLLVIPGVRLTDVLDASPQGARVRVATALRPGRTMTVHVRTSVGAGERPRTALVQRCWVHRLGRAGVVYEAGLTWDQSRQAR